MSLSNRRGRLRRCQPSSYRPRIEALEDRRLLSFITGSTYAVGSAPVSVAVGDFNRDGISDLAVVNSGNDTVSILLGNGNGTFQPAQSYATGTLPYSVAVGDFNGDGIPDLAVANTGSGTVSILLGNGDGTFQAALSSAVDIAPRAVAVGDFNGDGILDLAVAQGGFISSPGTVGILLGNGDGSFQPMQSYAAGDDPYSVAVGDFDGDGHLDLAVVNNTGLGTVSVLLGNGDGTFQAAQSYGVGVQPTSVAVGDFNGDGKLDLVVANSNPQKITGTVSVLLNNGNGSFGSAIDYAVAIDPSSVLVQDFNGDGIPDIAAAGDSGVSILLSKGDGSFLPPQSYSPGSGSLYPPAPASVAVGDFNSDGSPDLAIAFADINAVSVLLGKGHGTLQAAQTYGFEGGASAVAVGDFNRDGFSDLAVANESTGTLTILLGQSDGSFQVGQTYFVGTQPRAVAVGDFNGDGIPDLAVASNGSPTVMAGSITVLLGNGDGTFQAVATFSAGQGPTSIAVGDFNGDGKQDIVTTNYAFVINPRPYSLTILENDVLVFLGNGDGTFQPAQSYAADLAPRSVAVGDFNGDGVLDLAVGNSDPTNPAGSVSILLGNGDGTFQPFQTYALGTSTFSLAAGDFNGDGILDLAVAGNDTGTVSILLGNGNGTFQAAGNYAVGVQPRSLVIGDFNRDGILDVAVVDYGSSAVSVLMGIGDGTFASEQRYVVGILPSFIALGDFNNDGFLDLALVANAEVTILLNAADWSGGQAGLPPDGSAFDPSALPILLPESSFVSLAASQSDMLHASSAPVAEDRTNPVENATVLAETKRSTPAEGIFSEASSVTTRPAVDALFERWADTAAAMLLSDRVAAHFTRWSMGTSS